MISYDVREGSLWHCTSLVRRLRPEQARIAIGLGLDARGELRAAYRMSGITRSWISRDGQILAMMGVTGPMLATEGTVWLALSKEALRYPKEIVRQARSQLTQTMMFKHRLYADPFVGDPASVRFAKWLGFVELPNQHEAKKVGAIAMVLSLNTEAYVENRVERAN